MDRSLEDIASAAQACPEKIIETTHNLEFDICRSRHIVDRVREDETYAQNLYAALCNTEWQEQDAWEVLRDKTWSCSWRTAGGIIADIRGEGDYMDWYCSGMMTYHPDDDLGDGPRRKTGAVPEGTVTDEIEQDLLAIGWRQVG